MTAIVKRLETDAYLKLIEGVENKIIRKDFIPASGTSQHEYSIVNVSPGKYIAVLSFINDDGQEIYFSYDLDDRDEQIDGFDVLEGIKTQVDFLNVSFDTTDLRTVSFFVLNNKSEKISEIDELKKDFFESNWVLESGSEIKGETIKILPSYGHDATTKKGDLIISDDFLRYLGITFNDIPERFKIAVNANEETDKFTVTEKNGKKVVELTGEESFDNKPDRDKNFPILTKFKATKINMDSGESKLSFFIPESTNFKIGFEAGKEILYDKFSQAEVKVKISETNSSIPKKYDEAIINLENKEYYLILHSIGVAEATDVVYGTISKAQESKITFVDKPEREINYPNLNISLQRENSDGIFKTAYYPDFLSKKNVLGKEDTIIDITGKQKFEYNFKFIQEGSYFAFFNVEEYFKTMRKKIIDNESYEKGSLDIEMVFSAFEPSSFESSAPMYARYYARDARRSFPSKEENFLSREKERLFLLLSEKANVFKDKPGGAELNLKYAFVEFVKVGVRFEISSTKFIKQALAKILVEECNAYVVSDKYKDEKGDFKNYAVPYLPFYTGIPMANYNLKPRVILGKVVLPPISPALEYHFFSRNDGDFALTEFFLLPKYFLGKDFGAKYNIVFYPKNYKDYLPKRKEGISGSKITREQLEKTMGVDFSKNKNIVGSFELKPGTVLKRVAKNITLKENGFGNESI